jgi:CubicO group peptidase (beta-lactamase class C family)
MNRTEWITNIGQGEGGAVTNLYSATSTARDLARFGRMVMDGGRWNGRRLVGAAFIRTLLTPSQTLNLSYGLLWWSNALPGTDATGQVSGRRFPQSPRDTVAALGAGGQAILLVPSRRLTIIRQGDSPRSANLFDDLASSVVASLKV